MAEINISKDNFEQEIMKSEVPVLIDLWATWCGPCRMLEPIVREIAEEYEGKIKVAKINVDEETALADVFQVSAIPKLVLVRNREIVEEAMGLMPKDAIEDMIKKIL